MKMGMLGIEMPAQNTNELSESVILGRSKAATSNALFEHTHINREIKRLNTSSQSEVCVINGMLDKDVILQDQLKTIPCSPVQRSTTQPLKPNQLEIVRSHMIHRVHQTSNNLLIHDFLIQNLRASTVDSDGSFLPCFYQNGSMNPTHDPSNHCRIRVLTNGDDKDRIDNRTQRLTLDNKPSWFNAF